jgi:hypothetical protein
LESVLEQNSLSPFGGGGADGFSGGHGSVQESGIGGIGGPIITAAISAAHNSAGSSSRHHSDMLSGPYITVASSSSSSSASSYGGGFGIPLY